MKYKVKQEGKAWIVYNDKDQPCHKKPHPTREQAERHCEALIAFFGRTVADNETK